MGFFAVPVVLFTSAISHLFMVTVLKSASAGRAAAVDAKAPKSLRQAWELVRRSPELYGPVIRTALVMVTCGTPWSAALEAKENIRSRPIGYGRTTWRHWRSVPVSGQY